MRASPSAAFALPTLARLAACSIGLFLLASGTLAPLSAQEDAGEVADEREVIAELLDALSGQVKRKGDEDEQAIGTIDRLYQEFPASGPKDKKAIVSGLERCFKAKRTRELEPGVPDDRLFYAAAVALGDMAPESVKPLMGLLGHRSHKKNLRLQGRIALSLGKTRDPRGVKPLLGLLDSKDAVMQAAAADALAEYDGAELKERKEIFKALLDTLMENKAEAEEDASDIEAYQRWTTISGPIVACLQRLSGHDERVPDAWQRWWNKNKKADWDAGGR